MSAGAPYVVELESGVFAYVQPDGGWCLNNAGWVGDGDTTLLVDTAATERRARALRAALLDSGAAVPDLVVNTHHHGDHTYGNCVFAPEARVVSHAACRREAIAAGAQLELIWPETDYGDIELRAADLTYEDRMTLHGVGAELIHPGPAHTVGDTIVWLPRQRVVFTGDLIFEGGTPFVLMGSLTGSLRTLDLLRGLGARTVVPGHGEVTDPAVFDQVERYLLFVGRVAEEARAKGRTPLEAARETDLGEFAELRERERLVANLHRAYAELAGEPLGSPIDPIAAFADMAALNGGRMMACHA